MDSTGKVVFAVVGFGYWGPHLVRNISLTEDAVISYVCDLDAQRLREGARRFPFVAATQQYEDVLRDPSVDVVAIATPVTSHHHLAVRALRAGKHVLVEKPLASSSAEALDILATAHRYARKVFVDHTFIFTPAVRKLGELLLRDELGRLLYYDSVRVNLGIFQHDVNVVWDLMTHDIAILDFLLQGRMPLTASCTGAAHFGAQHEDLAYLTLSYEDDFIAHINVNWLAPVKVRQVLVCGDRKMAVYDDNSASEKLKIYDSGVSVQHAEDLYQTLVQYRVGDMHAPRLEMAEALATEIENIVDVVANGAAAQADGACGLRVVAVLEAADHSLRRAGIATPIQRFDSAGLDIQEAGRLNGPLPLDGHTTESVARFVEPAASTQQ